MERGKTRLRLPARDRVLERMSAYYDDFYLRHRIVKLWDDNRPHAHRVVGKALAEAWSSLPWAKRPALGIRREDEEALGALVALGEAGTVSKDHILLLDPRVPPYPAYVWECSHLWGHTSFRGTGWASLRRHLTGRHGLSEYAAALEVLRAFSASAAHLSRLAGEDDEQLVVTLAPRWETFLLLALWGMAAGIVDSEVLLPDPK